MDTKYNSKEEIIGKVEDFYSENMIRCQEFLQHVLVRKLDEATDQLDEVNIELSTLEDDLCNHYTLQRKMMIKKTDKETKSQTTESVFPRSERAKKIFQRKKKIKETKSQTTETVFPISVLIDKLVNEIPFGEEIDLSKTHEQLKGYFIRTVNEADPNTYHRFLKKFIKEAFVVVAVELKKKVDKEVDVVVAQREARDTLSDITEKITTKKEEEKSAETKRKIQTFFKENLDNYKAFALSMNKGDYASGLNEYTNFLLAFQEHMNEPADIYMLDELFSLVSESDVSIQQAHLDNAVVACDETLELFENDIFQSDEYFNPQVIQQFKTTLFKNLGAEGDIHVNLPDGFVANDVTAYQNKLVPAEVKLKSFQGLIATYQKELKNHPPKQQNGPLRESYKARMS